MQTIVLKHQPDPTRLNSVDDALLAKARDAHTPEQISAAISGRTSAEVRGVVARMLFDNQYSASQAFEIARLSGFKSAQNVVVEHILGHEGWFPELVGDARRLARGVLDPEPAHPRGKKRQNGSH